jgi:hypothetical protein
MTYVRQDDYAIGREVHIRLEGMRTDIHGALESAHGVLGPLGLVAAVGDGLRQEAAWISPGSDGAGPGSCWQSVSRSVGQSVSRSSTVLDGQRCWCHTHPWVRRPLSVYAQIHLTVSEWLAQIKVVCLLVQSMTRIKQELEFNRSNHIRLGTCTSTVSMGNSSHGRPVLSDLAPDGL